MHIEMLLSNVAITLTFAVIVTQTKYLLVELEEGGPESIARAVLPPANDWPLPTTKRPWWPMALGMLTKRPFVVNATALEGKVHVLYCK